MSFRNVISDKGGKFRTGLDKISPSNTSVVIDSNAGNNLVRLFRSGLGKSQSVTTVEQSVVEIVRPQLFRNGLGKSSPIVATTTQPVIEVVRPQLFRKGLGKRDGGSATAAPTIADFSCLLFAIDADLSTKNYSSGINLSQVNDLSSGGNNASASGSPQYIANAYGSKGVIRFTTSNYLSISIPNVSAFSLYIECTRSTTTNGYLLGTANSSLGSSPAIISGFAGDFEYYHFTESLNQPRTVISATAPTGLNKILVLHDGSRNVKTYLNGSLIANLSNGIATPNNSNFARVNGNTIGDRATYDLKTMAIFSGILTASDITKLFTL